MIPFSFVQFVCLVRRSAFGRRSVQRFWPLRPAAIQLTVLAETAIECTDRLIHIWHQVQSVLRCFVCSQRNQAARWIVLFRRLTFGAYQLSANQLISRPKSPASRILMRTPESGRWSTDQVFRSCIAARFNGVAKATHSIPYSARSFLPSVRFQLIDCNARKTRECCAATLVILKRVSYLV